MIKLRILIKPLTVCDLELQKEQLLLKSSFN